MSQKPQCNRCGELAMYPIGIYREECGSCGFVLHLGAKRPPVSTEKDRKVYLLLREYGSVNKPSFFGLQLLVHKVYSRTRGKKYSAQGFAFIGGKALSRLMKLQLAAYSCNGWTAR